MKQPSSWAAAYVTPLFVLLVTITVLMIGASNAWAYEAYSQGNDSGNCATCHGDFRGNPYSPPSGEADWEDDLHDVHRNDMLGGDCSTCHAASGGFFPVSLESSGGGDGLEPISCVGCHGRDDDMGQTTATGTAQRGAGLRQHHAGVASCGGCHDDQTGYTPVGENVLPNYYEFPGNNHPAIPTDPCNANAEEGAFGGNLFIGLDNDGDGIYDTGDSDCTTNEPPVADPNGPYSGTAGSPVLFDGTGSSDPDGTVASYDWDFGDGNTGTGDTPSHSYAADGTYTVSLTVTDNDGASSAPATTTATIEPVPNEPPVADPNGPYSGTAGSPVLFDGTGSSDPDGTVASYDWDFGDGNTGTGDTPSHSYAADGTYTVSLTVTDNDGASSAPATTTATIEPVPNEPPVADPNGPYSGTAGSPVLFDGTGSSDPDGTVASYDWDFGDGNTGTGDTPSHSYAADGTYTVSLTVTDNDGASSAPATTTATIEPVPNEPPVADPNGPYSGTAGSPVLFDGTGSSDPDGTVASYDWDFGDGNTGTGDTPSHSYAADGTYTVSLTVTDNDGASSAPATTTATIEPVPNEPPVADPNGPYSGTAGSPVLFDGTGSSDPDGTVASYDWDFGDGNTGTGDTPSHSYAADGTYTVSLTVTDNDGASSAPATTTATIEPVPNEPPVADPNGPYSGSAGSPVLFDGTGSSDPDGTVASYDWDFGDGNTGTGDTPSHSYAADGTYTVSLTVTDNDGASSAPATTTATIEPVPNEPPVADPNGPYSGTAGSPVLFDGTGSSDPDGTIVAYDWDFGDGNTGTGDTPSHSYAADGTYTVSLTVTDNDGASSAPATTTATIEPVPNEPPVADPNGPYSGTAGSPVLFDGTGSSDPDGTIVAYDWDFGDGNTGTGDTPSHSYAADGTYTVSLTVTDNDGASSAPATTTATIEPVPNEPPVADPNGPYSGTAGSPVLFDGTGSSDPDGTIVAYDWDFGDGNTGTGDTPSHSYAADGTYTVSLTVTDNDGASSAPATTTATIEPVPNEPPVADPNGPYSGTAGSPVLFDGTGSSDPDGTIVAYDWDFGDGNTGTGDTPSHSYAADGTYTVSLTVTDNDGASSAPATTTATIEPVPNEPPVADPNGPYSGTAGSPVLFDGTGSSDPDGTIVAYDWDFGDGNTGTGDTPSHSYAADGTYTVSLTVTDNDGASDTDTTTATIEGDMVQVMVCHKPGQNNEKTLLVDPPAESAHLRHGDFRGPCDD